MGGIQGQSKGERHPQSCIMYEISLHGDKAGIKLHIVSDMNNHGFGLERAFL